MGYFDIQALPTDKGQHSVDLLNYRGHPFQLPKKFLAAMLKPASIETFPFSFGLLCLLLVFFHSV